MIDLTFEQITAAKANDLDAVTAVITATEDRVQQIARKAATSSAMTNLSQIDDYAQQGRIAVWEALARFEGNSVAQFFSFIDMTVKGTLARGRRTETRQGVSEAASYDFESALRLANGDAYEAQRIASDVTVVGKRRMSPEMALAARLSWQGVEYLDAPAYGGEDGEDVPSLASIMADALAMPEDLIEVTDMERERKRLIAERVHATLAKMGKQAANILRAAHGFPGHTYYPLINEKLDVAPIARDLGMDPAQLKSQYSKAKDRFEVLWLKGETQYAA